MALGWSKPTEGPSSPLVDGCISVGEVGVLYGGAARVDFRLALTYVPRGMYDTGRRVTRSNSRRFPTRGYIENPLPDRKSVV